MFLGSKISNRFCLFNHRMALLVWRRGQHDMPPQACFGESMKIFVPKTNSATDGPDQSLTVKTNTVELVEEPVPPETDVPAPPQPAVPPQPEDQAAPGSPTTSATELPPPTERPPPTSPVGSTDAEDNICAPRSACKATSSTAAAPEDAAEMKVLSLHASFEASLWQL